jgi:ribulose-phosphate 3-epimerase
MTQKVLIAPSLLAARFDQLGDEVRAVTHAGADILHFDIMDGHFVPNLTMGPDLVKALRPLSPLPFDVHLMVNTPAHWIAPFVDAGANMISIHVEATHHLHRYLEVIKSLGAKAGIAVNPTTPIAAFASVLDMADYVLIMTVNPGFGGQKLIPSQLKKITELRQIIDDAGYACQIQVDGGINKDTAKQVIQAGADILVAGTAIFGQSLDQYEAAMAMLRHS